MDQIDMALEAAAAAKIASVNRYGDTLTRPAGKTGFRDIWEPWNNDAQAIELMLLLGLRVTVDRAARVIRAEPADGFVDELVIGFGETGTEPRYPLRLAIIACGSLIRAQEVAIEVQARLAEDRGYTLSGSNPQNRNWDMAASCRVCGCTDDRDCPGGCHWVMADLCSACVTVSPEEGAAEARAVGGGA